MRVDPGEVKQTNWRVVRASYYNPYQKLAAVVVHTGKLRIAGVNPRAYSSSLQGRIQAWLCLFPHLMLRALSFGAAEVCAAGITGCPVQSVSPSVMLDILSGGQLEGGSASMQK